MAIKVTGRQLLREKLANIPKFAKVELQTAMDDSAQKLVDAQRRSASRSVRTGELQMSIKKESFSRGGIGAIVKAGGEATMKEVRKGSSVFYDYAMAVELGTQDMLAEPFFYPTYRRMKPTIKRRATKAVKTALSKAVKT